VQEEERSEPARDLHDEIGPLLFAVSVDLSVIQQDEAVRSTAVAARIESIRESITRMYKDVKAILARLRPASLVDLGLAQAAESLVNFWQTRYPDIVFVVRSNAEGFGTPIDDAMSAFWPDGDLSASLCCDLDLRQRVKPLHRENPKDDKDDHDENLRDDERRL
jgi:two-component system sensor histidine kinase UhpB